LILAIDQAAQRLADLESRSSAKNLKAAEVVSLSAQTSAAQAELDSLARGLQQIEIDEVDQHMAALEVERGQWSELMRQHEAAYLRAPELAQRFGALWIRHG